MLAIAALGVLLVVPDPVVGAAGADPCPEPNDAFQAACYLGPGGDALGFISRPDDVDAYRFEALDDGAQVRLELADMPAQYRLHIANWNGVVIGESSSHGGLEALEVTLGPPGSYYAFVDSRTGEATDTVPYRLVARLTYAAGPPQVLYQNDFGTNAKGLCTHGYVRDGFAECNAVDGRLEIRFDTAVTAQTWGYIGPEAADFTLSVDTRLVRNPKGAVYRVIFRSGATNELSLIVDATNQRIRLKKSGTGAGELLQGQEWDVGAIAPIDATGGVNRTVIACTGPEIRISLNGVEVVHLRDDVVEPGRIGFGALPGGESPVIAFDNVLLTIR